MWTNFIEEVVLCENCNENYEAKRFVSSRTECLKQLAAAAASDESVTEEFLRPAPSKGFSKTIQWGVIVAAVAIISAQLYFYNNPAQVQQDPEALAREQQLSSLVQRMLVFREIGLVLQERCMASNEMRCADSAAANIIRNEDGNIRLYHPNPQYRCYEEISVADSSPEPNIVRAGQ